MVRQWFFIHQQTGDNMKPTTKEAIKKHLDGNISFILFGSVSISSLRTSLKLSGLQRLPKDTRLKAMIIDLYSDKVTGDIGFIN